jgi:hypothetical protein
MDKPKTFRQLTVASSCSDDARMEYEAMKQFSEERAKLQQRRKKQNNSNKNSEENDSSENSSSSDSNVIQDTRVGLCTGMTIKGISCKRKAVRDGMCNSHAPIYVPSKAYGGKCITITFCEVAENGVGMEQLGELRSSKFTVDYLIQMQTEIPDSEIIDLTIPRKLVKDRAKLPESACLLVMRNYISEPRKVFDELVTLKWDSKAIFRGVVKNKLARHNLCFTDKTQEAEYEQGKGTIFAFKTLPKLKAVREQIQDQFDEDLIAEGNLYYDVTRCGLSPHGDFERNIVIAVRLGEAMNLCYQWYYQSEPVGNKYVVNLNSGDVYVMSVKAVGHDWKKRSQYTLRHSAGCTKYTGV